jgi:hypothetical protein
MVRWQVLALLCLSSFVGAQQQDSITVGFQVKFNNQPFEMGKTYTAKEQTLAISAFKCYVSGFSLIYADGSSTTNKDYHLLDVERPGTFRFNVGGDPKKLLSKIIFSIGVDSLTSVSGAMPGDLDPTKGMFWAWQSGYINMKIEGTSPLCQTSKNEFQFHIGGYLKPNDALRKIEMETTKPEIEIDLAAFFSHIKLSEQNSVMIPGKAAMQLADLSIKMFHPK